MIILVNLNVYKAFELKITNGDSLFQLFGSKLLQK